MRLDEMKAITAMALTDPLTDWIDEMLDRKADPQTAFAALALFLGHALAGAAVELGVASDGLGERSAEIIAETADAEIARMQSEVTESGK